MAVEHTIGGLTAEEISGFQNGCVVYRSFARRDRSFCNAECLWTKWAGLERPICPQTDEQNGDAIVPKSKDPVVDSRILAKDRAGNFISVFDQRLEEGKTMIVVVENPIDRVIR